MRRSAIDRGSWALIIRVRTRRVSAEPNSKLCARAITGTQGLGANRLVRSAFSFRASQTPQIPDCRSRRGHSGEHLRRDVSHFRAPVQKRIYGQSAPAPRNSTPSSGDPSRAGVSGPRPTTPDSLCSPDPLPFPHAARPPPARSPAAAPRSSHAAHPSRTRTVPPGRDLRVRGNHPRRSRARRCVAQLTGGPDVIAAPRQLRAGRACRARRGACPTARVRDMPGRPQPPHAPPRRGARGESALLQGRAASDRYRSSSLLGTPV